MVLLIPDKEIIHRMLESTGAVRKGHFEIPNGYHVDTFYQMPLALRHFNNILKLGVALSRLLRHVPGIRAELPKITIVAPASGGIPVAFTVREALSAEQVVWAEKSPSELYFRPYAGIESGANCVLVDDIMLTSTTLKRLVNLVEQNQGNILGIGVLVDAGIQTPTSFGNIPFRSLISYQTQSYPNAAECSMCKQGVAVEKIRF